MLTQLTIKNYALIKHLEMQPSGGLNVITGETGAGKSIMLGALGLLLGKRADTKALWDEKEKCITEAEFDISLYGLEPLFRANDLDYSDTTVIRREISPGGKGRAFINDTPVTIETLGNIVARLMDIHSQHETLELSNRRFQLQLIDAYADNRQLRRQYDNSWKEFLQVKEKHEALLRELTILQHESDFVAYQLEELVKADFQENEQGELESELKIQEHAEEIKNRLNMAIGSLTGSDYSVRAVLSEIKGHLGALSPYASGYELLFKRIDSLRIEFDDIVQELEREEAKVEFDQHRLEEVNERLSLIYQLLQKHRVGNIGELITLRRSLSEKADKSTNRSSLLAESEELLNLKQLEVQRLAKALSETRVKAFAPLTKKIAELLRELGIQEGQVKMDHHITAPGASGIDSIDILFSANKGIQPRALAQVASGGEFSRLMFCFKSILAEKTAMPTLVLDELDTGVSGEIAMSLGRLMKEMSQRHQVIAISHLPQIAARGNTHYLVFKDNSEKKTISVIKKLDDLERVEEIAKMIGGARPSATAIKNAQELISG